MSSKVGLGWWFPFALLPVGTTNRPTGANKIACSMLIKSSTSWYFVEKLTLKQNHQVRWRLTGPENAEP